MISTFTATIGAGIKVNRFVYLGQGNFNVVTSQVVNTLNTEPVYANAVMC